jgi:hypothetical protein
MSTKICPLLPWAIYETKITYKELRLGNKKGVFKTVQLLKYFAPYKFLNNLFQFNQVLINLGVPWEL